MQRHTFESRYLRFRVQVLLHNGHAVLIDPGVLPADGQRVQQFLNHQSLSLDAILFTHTHGDHFACWQFFPDVPTVGGQTILEKPEARRENDVKYVYSIWRKFQAEAPFTVQFPRIDHPLPAEGVWSWNGISIRYYQAPGHATDHGIFILPEQRWLFSGDMLIHIPQPFILQGFIPYFLSLKKLKRCIQEYQIRTVIPAHGPELTSPTAIENQIQTEQEYIQAVVTTYLDLKHQGMAEAEIQHSLLKNFTVNGTVLHSHRVNVNTLLREAERNPDWSQILET